MEVLPVIPKRFKFAKGATWLFLGLFILALAYTHYRAEIIFHGEFGEKYFNYYVISLAGILFWGGVLRLGGEIQANIVTVAISLIIGVYTVEGGLYFQGQRIESEKVAAAAKLGIEFDDRTVLGVTEDLIAEGVDAVPFGPNLRLGKEAATKPELLLPLGGVSNKTIVLMNESGQHGIYKSDRYGFNNPDSQWDLPKIEWLLTGDSYTEGFSVQQGEDIAGQIRSITKSSVINIGIASNGPLLELAALKEYGPSLHPKRVLWIYFEGNDLSELEGEKKLPKLMQYLQDDFSQNLINRQKEIDHILLKYIKTQMTLYKTRWMRLYAVRQLIEPVPERRSCGDFILDPLLAKILIKAKERTEAWGGKLYFVYLPEFSRYNETVDDHDDLHREKSEVIELVRGLNIPVIDIHQEVFTDHPDPLALFPPGSNVDSHYAAEGYSEVAKAIVSGVTGEQKSRKTIDEGD